MKRPVTVVLLIVVVLGVLICGLRTVVGVGESSVAVVSSGLPQTEAEPRTSQTATSPARAVAAPVQEEAQEGDEDNVVVMHVVLRPFDAAHWEGLSAFSGVSMPMPEQVELGTDVLSQATVDLRAAERAYTETVRSKAAARMADGEESESAFEAAFAMYPHIIEARRDAKRKHSEAAQRTSDHVWEPQTQPWASFLALSATSRTLFDSPSIRPSGELEALANELIGSNPDHAVSDHARLLLATLASDPEAASFDPEIATARIATLVESAVAEDMSEVLEAAARLMVVLPGEIGRAHV